MHGFEYAAAGQMIQNGMVREGMAIVEGIRARYDGERRNPFDEAECGHHYARAMASWAAVPALTGFHYSGVEKSMTFAAAPGKHFWSNGYTWGTCSLRRAGGRMNVELSVLQGDLMLSRFALSDYGTRAFETPVQVQAGQKAAFVVARGK